MKLDEIGDVVLTTPFLRELRRTHPKSEIVAVANPRTSELLKAVPYIDVVVFEPRGGPLSLGVLTGAWQARRFALRTLRQRRFGAALVPRWDTDWYQATLIAF